MPMIPHPSVTEGEAHWTSPSLYIFIEAFYLFLASSSKEVSEGSTGAWICVERRLSGLRAAKESLEAQRQVPVGAAASALINGRSH